MNETYGKAGLARNVLRAALAVDGFMLFAALCAAVNNNGGGAALLMLFLAGLTGAALWYATKEGLWFVWRLERVWKHVCGHIGFSGEARSFKHGCKGAFIDGETKTIYPQLKNVRGNWQAWTAEVRFFDGQTLDSYNQHAQAYAMAFNVPYTSFELAENGLIRVRCGQMQVPEPYDYPMQTQRLDDDYGAPVRLRPQPPTLDSGAAARFEPTTLLDAARTVNPAALFAQAEAEARATLQALPMAVDIAGRVWTMPVEGNHLLICGRTGAGKSSWVWSLVFGLKNVRDEGIVRLWGLDPKKIELGYGREWWDEYADTTEGMIELLEKAVSDLLDRNAAIQGKARKVQPSMELPLNVIIIDELAYLSAFISDNKKLLARAENAIKTILALGRATGYVLVGCSQDPRKEVLGFRDYFPTKVGLAMEAEMVDLVFGKGAHDAGGAYCEQIPLREAGAGCAYVKEEMSRRLILVRTAMCSDEAIKSMMRPQVQPLAQGYEQGYVQQLGFDGQPLG